MKNVLLAFAFFSLLLPHSLLSQSLEEEIDELKKELPNEYALLGHDLFSATVVAMQEKLRSARSSDSPVLCNGRLTLSSGNPIANVSSSSTVYFTPLDGNKIALYDGSAWRTLSFSETSVGVPATTSTPFDIFAYSNSGTLALEAVSWTNDTTRATALTTQNGVWVKSGATTRRYLGTGRTTTSSGTIEDSDSRRFLWNMYNRVPRKLLAYQTTSANWTYGTQAYRAANGSSTVGATRVEYIIGMQTEPISITTFVPEVGGGNLYAAIGVGINSSTAISSEGYGSYAGGSYPAFYALYRNLPSLGYSYAQWIEYSQNPSGASTGFYTYYNDATYHLIAGILGEIWS